MTRKNAIAPPKWTAEEKSEEIRRNLADWFSKVDNPDDLQTKIRATLAGHVASVRLDSLMDDARPDFLERLDELAEHLGGAATALEGLAREYAPECKKIFNMTATEVSECLGELARIVAFQRQRYDADYANGTGAPAHRHIDRLITELARIYYEHATEPALAARANGQRQLTSEFKEFLTKVWKAQPKENQVRSGNVEAFLRRARKDKYRLIDVAPRHCPAYYSVNTK